MPNKSFNRKKGALGEVIAVRFLKLNGYEILECNWHYSVNAEIDIVAKDGKELVFVEVKTRSSSNYGHPFEAVNSKKIERMQMAAFAYIEKNALHDMEYRFDVDGILNPKNPTIEHLKGISLD